MISKLHNVIVVMPVYEDYEASSQLLKELEQRLGSSVYIVAIDDGSIKRPLKISWLQTALVEGVILTLRRNVGHQKAISIGLGYAAEYMHPHQSLVIMDSDGEDLPSSVSALLMQLKDIPTDIVVAKRQRRVETFRFKLFYMLYRYFFALMTGRAINFGNFMALKPFAVKRLVAMQELSIHVAAAVLASKLRVSVYPLDRGPRYAGQSKMNFLGLALHGFKALMVFAEDVLVRVGVACVVFAVFAILGATAAIALKLLGFSTPGWFSIALGILVLMFMQTGALALMTLMLTGVVRSGSVTTATQYHEFVESVIKTPEINHQV